MPHIILEKSNNVTEEKDSNILFKEAIELMLNDGIIPNPNCVKCREIKAENSFLYDQSDKYIHLTLSLLEGRDPEKLKSIAKKLKNLAEKFFPETSKTHPHAFSLEVREIDKNFYQK